jgi:ATP-dependent Clp protease ATP-binding subunit ClpB
VRIRDAGRDAMEAAAMRELASTFRPEFLNRIDEIIVFEPLAKDQMGAIARIQLARYHKLLTERELTLTLTDRAVAMLGERGYDPTYGARPLKRTIQRLVVDPLALEILAGRFTPGDQIVGDLAGDDRVVFTRTVTGAAGAAA